MESYVKQAVNIGLQEICFLDHLIVSGDGIKNSMCPQEVGLYFQAVQKFKYQYQKQIKIRVGLEVDFHPDQVDRIQEIIKPFSFDVIGSSIHFAGGMNIVSRREKTAFSEMEFENVCMQYLEEMNHMLDYEYFDVICHLDVIKKFHTILPDKIVEKFDEILSKIRYKNLTVEVNTSGKNHPAQEIYPGLDLLKRCLNKGIEITLASDAHHPEKVGQYNSQVLSELVSVGFTHLAGFNRRKRYMMPIDMEGDRS
jgi:histidinol-phosphatase (PHP family)